MAAVETRVVRAVIRAHFGPVVEATAWALVSGGAQTSQAIVSRLAATAANPFSVRQGLPVLALGVRAVRDALVVLIQHALVSVVDDPLSSSAVASAGSSNVPACSRTGRVAYLLDVRAVLMRVGLPMLIAASAQPGSERETVLLDVVRCGRLSLSSLSRPQQDAANELVNEGILTSDSFTPLEDADAYYESSPKRSRVFVESPRAKGSSLNSSGRSSPAVRPVPTGHTFVRVSHNALARQVLLAGVVDAVRRYMNRGAAVLLHVLLSDVLAKARSGAAVDNGTPVTALVHAAEAHATDGCALCRVPPRTPLAKILPVEWRGERIPTSEAQRKSLRVLVEHYMERASAQLPFITRDVRTTSGLGTRGEAANRAEASFLVNVDNAREWLRGEAALALASASHGAIAARILRVARAAGLVEERTVCSRALTAPIAVRTALFALHSAGHIAQQEVPRTADRTPKSMFYLWALPRPRARLWRTCASHLLKAISARIDAAATEVDALVDPVASAMACRVLRPSAGVASLPDSARMADTKSDDKAQASALGQPPEAFKAAVAASGASALSGSDALQLTDAELARLDAASAASSAAWRVVLPAFREYVLFACDI